MKQENNQVSDDQLEKEVHKPGTQLNSSEKNHQQNGIVLLAPELLNFRLDSRNYHAVYLEPRLFKRLRIGNWQKGLTSIPQGAGKSRICSSFLRSSFGKSSPKEWNLLHSLDKQSTVTKLATSFKINLCGTEYQFFDAVGIKTYKDLKVFLKIVQEEYLDKDDIQLWVDEKKDNAIITDKNLEALKLVADKDAPEVEIYFDSIIMILPANLDVNSPAMQASIDLIRTLGSNLTYKYPIVVVITFAKSHEGGVQPIKDHVKEIVDESCLYEVENYELNSEWSDSQDHILRSVMNSLVHQSHKLNNSVLKDTYYNRVVMFIGMVVYAIKKAQRKIAALSQRSNFSAMGLIFFLLAVIVVLVCLKF